MLKKVCLVAGNHLCHNPRVLKEADALHAAGYRVEVLGAWLDPKLKERDKGLMKSRAWSFLPVIDFGSAVTRVATRARSRIGRLAGEARVWQNGWQLGYCAPELLRAARRSGADLFIAHSEQALWVAQHLLAEGRNVGVDMEDWYSEDGRDGDGRPRALLRRLEHDLLRRGRHSTCTSGALARALATEYGCREPLVIYNAFEWEARRRIDGLMKDRRDSAVRSLHWYSQTLGPDRGLEDLFRALPLLRQAVEIHLRGTVSPGAGKWLASSIPPGWRDRVFVHPLVMNDELLSRIAEHDIGFAGETKRVRSRDLTVTNKIMHYLLAGLAVVASDTAGQTEIARDAEGAVVTYPCGDEHTLAERIDTLLDAPARLAAARQAALAVAQRSYSWQKMAPRLVAGVAAALGE